MAGDLTSMEDFARDLRAFLRRHGREVADCLPGEPRACGASLDQHMVSYLICVKALCDFLIARSGIPPARAMDLFSRELAELAEVYPDA